MSHGHDEGGHDEHGHDEHGDAHDEHGHDAHEAESHDSHAVSATQSWTRNALFGSLTAPTKHKGKMALGALAAGLAMPLPLALALPAGAFLAPPIADGIRRFRNYWGKVIGI